MNISNDYITADIEEVESDIHPTASLSPNLNETDTKGMTSYLTETDSDDAIPEHKHFDICNLELMSLNNILFTVSEKLMQKTSLHLKKCQSLFDTLD